MGRDFEPLPANIVEAAIPVPRALGPDFLITKTPPAPIEPRCAGSTATLPSHLAAVSNHESVLS